MTRGPWPASTRSCSAGLSAGARAERARRGDLAAAVAVAAEAVEAVEAGATLAEVQPQDDVRVLLDPEGHLFCLWGR